MIELLLSAGSLLDLGFNTYQPVFGQIVNVGFGPAGILGLLIAGAGAGLYFMRSMRPELARDHDIFFAAIGLLCGGILFFQGWRLDPILLFGQMLLAGSAVFFATESIRLRGVATEQARRNTPIVDDDRPVGQVYRAELDELYPSDEAPPVRRIRGTRNGRSSTRETYDEDRSRSSYEDRDRSSYGDTLRSSYDGNPQSSKGDRWSEEPQSSRRSRGRRNSINAPQNDQDYPSRRRPRRSMNDRVASTSTDTYSRRSRSSRSRSYDRGSEMGDRPRKRSSRSGFSAQDNYVDYRPIDYSDGAQRYDDELS